MITREKLRKIFPLHDKDFTKNIIDNYKKVVVNTQMKSKNAFNNNEIATSERNIQLKKPIGTEDTISYNLINDQRRVSGHYYKDKDGNNMIVVAAVSLKDKNLNLHDIDMDSLKNTINYKAEEEERTTDLIINSSQDTFHRAVGPILFLGQCFAIMPVMGVLKPSPKHLKFSLKSIQIIVFVFIFCSSSILTITMLKFLLKVGMNAKNIVGLVFFGCVQCSCYLFSSLAIRWPKIMRYWSKVELIFTQKPYEMPKRCLAKRVRFAACIIIVCSVVEHGLYLASAITSYRNAINFCAAKRNFTEQISFENYVHRNYDYVFEILPYNIFVGIFILLINGACTFTWNYMDLFIMMVSKGVAYRFEQITLRINKLAQKEIPETVFIEIREHYVKLCELLEFIDENLSGIILLSCINNLYFVCYQLLNVFNKLRWHINYVYFWYSLLYLIGRTAYIFLAAAAINDESKGGLAVLRKVSSRTWCVEVERLIFQMTTQTVALSGKKFYYLTRRLLFGMAGTIVTYELVLLQFDEPNRAKGLPDLCA